MTPVIVDPKRYGWRPGTLAGLAPLRSEDRDVPPTTSVPDLLLADLISVVTGAPIDPARPAWMAVAGLTHDQAVELNRLVDDWAARRTRSG